MKKKIRINVKTFFGFRKKYNFEIGITSTIQSLKKILIDSLQDNEKKSFYNLRLIYPMVFFKFK